MTPELIKHAGWTDNLSTPGHSPPQNEDILDFDTCSHPCLPLYTLGGAQVGHEAAGTSGPQGRGRRTEVCSADSRDHSETWSVLSCVCTWRVPVLEGAHCTGPSRRQARSWGGVRPLYRG